ncbi:hypothetical protein [Serratia marcescens]|uniref:hypothetical protein n=1 Tax=Serratia marcescens TaxID=615 RepID=UPI00124A47DA|nr:hypothetical protein [Serratia marcescens]KAB1578714.1 hypothetical protein F7687_22530 [Serratia marcescens]
MTNYQLLCFLQEDGGFYDVNGHIELLKGKFPDAGFDDIDIKNLRNIITRSTSIQFEKKWEEQSMKIRVVYVSPKYAKYSKAAIGIGRKREVPKWTYLEGEHQETVNAILRRQTFDRLLSECRGQSPR